jgi:uracil-DNA glycosylase family 4
MEARSARVRPAHKNDEDGGSNVSDSLEQVASEVRVCTMCQLHKTRTNAVPGEGASHAEIMFIGEGPGFHEDQSGRPFVGAAGNFLNELLEEIGLVREQVYIANVVKCRPPGNRDPEPGEIQACSGYLDRQIELIDPKVIVTLGRFSMARWFPSARISRIHGQARQFGGRLIVPFYHPAAALHQPSLRQAVLDDFRRLPEYVKQVQQGQIDASESGDDSGTDAFEQLSLF